MISLPLCEGFFLEAKNTILLYSAKLFIEER
jgi:hypothetical protein